MIRVVQREIVFSGLLEINQSLNVAYYYRNIIIKFDKLNWNSFEFVYIYIVYSVLFYRV